MMRRTVFSFLVMWFSTSGCSGNSDDQAASDTRDNSTSAVGGTILAKGGAANNNSLNRVGGNGGARRGSSTTTGGSGVGNTGTGGSNKGGNSASSTSSTPAIGGSSSGGSQVGGTTKGGASSGGTSARSTLKGGAGSGGTTASSSLKGGASSGGTSASSSLKGGASSGGTSAGVGGSSSSTGSLRLPTANAPFDYQIGSPYTPPNGVQVVSRDRNSPPAAGLYNICYVNGFQVQPDEESFWTAQHPTLILRDASGKPVIDADWNEMVVDTSTAAKRDEIAVIVGDWIRGCKTAGYDAIEIDNLDSYSRSKGLLTEANNVAQMALFSSIAHANGLAIAQKNSAEMLGNVRAMGTDFAVVEECNRYDECGDFVTAYTSRVFIIEYRAQDFQKGCTTYPGLSIVYRDVNVTAPGSSSYVYQGC